MKHLMHSLTYGDKIPADFAYHAEGWEMLYRNLARMTFDERAASLHRTLARNFEEWGAYPTAVEIWCWTALTVLIGEDAEDVETVPADDMPLALMVLTTLRLISENAHLQRTVNEVIAAYNIHLLG